MEYSPNYTISKLETDDVAAAEQLRAQSWLDSYVDEDRGIGRDHVLGQVGIRLTQQQLDLRRKTVDRADESRLLQRVAKDEQGEVIVDIVAHKDKSSQHIRALYVDKAHRGSGVAGDLISEGLEWFDAERPVHLEVVSYNDRAIRFYEKHGFAQVGGSDHMLSDAIPAINMTREGKL